MVVGTPLVVVCSKVVLVGLSVVCGVVVDLCVVVSLSDEVVGKVGTVTTVPVWFLMPSTVVVVGRRVEVVNGVKVEVCSCVVVVGTLVVVGTPLVVVCSKVVLVGLSVVCGVVVDLCVVVSLSDEVVGKVGTVTTVPVWFLMPSTVVVVGRRVEVVNGVKVEVCSCVVVVGTLVVVGTPLVVVCSKVVLVGLSVVCGVVVDLCVVVSLSDEVVGKVGTVTTVPVWFLMPSTVVVGRRVEVVNGVKVEVCSCVVVVGTLVVVGTPLVVVCSKVVLVGLSVVCGVVVDLCVVVSLSDEVVGKVGTVTTVPVWFLMPSTVVVVGRRVEVVNGVGAYFNFDTIYHFHSSPHHNC